MNRAYSDYSRDLLVAELRRSAASWWRIMHRARKDVAAATTDSDRKTQQGVERLARQRLTTVLELLNIGLDRRGSLPGAETRKWQRIIARNRERLDQSGPTTQPVNQ